MPNQQPNDKKHPPKSTERRSLNDALSAYDESNEPPSQKPWLIIGICAIIVVIIAIVLFVIKPFDTTPSAEKNTTTQSAEEKGNVTIIGDDTKKENSKSGSVKVIEDNTKTPIKTKAGNGYDLKDNNYEAPSNKRIKKHIQKDMSMSAYDKLIKSKKWVIKTKYDLSDGDLADVLVASDSFIVVTHNAKKVTSVDKFQSLTSTEDYAREILKAKTATNK